MHIVYKENVKLMSLSGPSFNAKIKHGYGYKVTYCEQYHGA